MTEEAQEVGPSSHNAAARESMSAFWEVHSRAATVEEMMLDSGAREIAKEERPEILGLLPDTRGKRVLELGAGIGRFTSSLAVRAGHVTAVDFMEKFVEKNRDLHGHHGNVTFLQADITQLRLRDDSFDVIFSNWLFMYLTDRELTALTTSLLSWLRPGGYLFFRESCFHQSGNMKRTFNPTVYRKPSDYNRMLTTAATAPDTEGRSWGFEIVMSKSVQAYIKLKHNRNQVCWLLQKASRDHSAHRGYPTRQQMLDGLQYSRDGIQHYERVYGTGFVSTGGAQSTQECVAMLGLSPGESVLDVGCGTGGGDFYMAKEFAVEVLGIDLSANMIEIAMERASLEETALVQFEVGDATKRMFPENSFDVVYSRDTILHIDDKEGLLKKVYLWLRPGGRLLITDYCTREGPRSAAFQEYIHLRGYHLYSVRAYTQLLGGVGFVGVRGEDRTGQFVSMLKEEIRDLEQIMEPPTQGSCEGDHHPMLQRWKEKLSRCEEGEQQWGVFYAEKPKGEGGTI